MIIYSYLKLSFREFKAFRLSFFLSILSELLNVGIFFLLWWVVFASNPVLEQWSTYDIILLIGFAELYMGIFTLVFVGFFFLPIYVVNGKLDDLLILPTNLLSALLGEQLQVSNFARPVVALFLLVYGMIIHPSLSITLIFLGLILGTLGLLLNNIIMASLNLLSFWIGKMGYIVDIISITDDALYVPLSRIKGLVQGFFTLFLPIYFISTFPVEMMTDKLSNMQLYTGTGILISLLFLWIIVFRKLWELGLKAYQSAGGL